MDQQPTPTATPKLAEGQAPATNETPTRRRVVAATGAAAMAALGAAAGRTTAPVTTTPPPPENTARRFEGQTVMITGATSGIGKATAEAFAREGADVWFCGRRRERGQEVERAIRASGGSATFVQTDVRDENQVRAFVDRILATTNRLDVGFNNAGISIAASFLETSSDAWDDIHHTNVRGVYYTMKYQLPVMAKAKRGSIVVTSSVQALASRATAAAYSSSKYALLGMVQAAALEFGSQGVRVNAILPGTVDTELVRRQSGAESLPDAAWQEASRSWGRTHVPGLRRMGASSEIANVVLDLSSPSSSFLTGASVPVDGAMSAALI